MVKSIYGPDSGGDSIIWQDVGMLVLAVWDVVLVLYDVE